MTASEQTAERDAEEDGADLGTLVDGLAPIEIGSYVRDLVQGMRRLTQRIDQRDVRFLDYLLAIVEEEARKVAENSYH